MILAAGRSARLGFAKALGQIEETVVLKQIHQTLVEGGCSDVCIVVAAPHGDMIQRSYPQFWYEVNQNPDAGMLGSFLTGLRAARACGAQRMVVGTLDQPRVTSRTVRALIEAAVSLDTCYLVPHHEGRCGHPFVVDTKLDVLDRDHCTTLRELLNHHRTRVEVDVPDPFILDDLDTPADAALLGVKNPRAEWSLDH